MGVGAEVVIVEVISGCGRYLMRLKSMDVGFK